MGGIVAKVIPRRGSTYFIIELKINDEPRTKWHTGFARIRGRVGGEGTKWLAKQWSLSGCLRPVAMLLANVRRIHLHAAVESMTGDGM